MGHGASKEGGDGVTSTTATTTTDGSTTETTSTTTTSTTTATGEKSNKRRHRPHFHSQSLIRQGSGKMMTPAATPASPTIRRPTTASVNSRIHAHTTDNNNNNNNNNNHRPVNRGGPSSPVARARAHHSPTPRVSPNRQRTGGGTVQKVMKHDELYDLLESMGFPRTVVMETVERLQVRGQRTVIDANALIEQLLQSSRLYASSNVIDSDQLARRITELSRSRELSASRGSPLSISQTRSPAPYSPSPLRPSTSSVSSSVSSSSTASSDTSVSETAEIFDPFGLIGDNSASLPAPLSNAAAYNPFTNPNPNAMDTTPSTTSNALVPVAQPPPPPEDDDDSGKCKICYDRPIDTVILRCGHLAICLRCSKQLKDCPICRKPITEIVRIYQV